MSVDPDDIEMYAVFENVSAHEAPDWATPRDSESVFIRLSAQMTQKQFTSFIASLCSYNRLAASNPEEATASLLSAKRLVLGGGIAVAKTTAEPVYPSCCCGLESWREWLGVIKTGASPWLGHDPSPWIECSDGKVTVWADGGLAETPKSQLPYCVIPVSDFASKLQRVEAELRDFLEPLRDFVRNLLGSRADDLIAQIDRKFHFTVDERHP